jgi:DNA-binding protein H-NS
MEALKAEAEQLKASEIAEVIDRIKRAIEVYGLKAVDLGFARPGRKPGTKAGTKAGTRPGTKPAAAGKGGAAAGKKAPARVKFRDGGNVWGGRGPRPKWLREALLAGKSLKDFAV